MYRNVSLDVMYCLHLVLFSLCSLFVPGSFLHVPGRGVSPVPLTVAEKTKGNTVPLLRTIGESICTYSLVMLLGQHEVAKAEVARNDVGFIDLNATEPNITDVCWLDIKIGDSENAIPQRLEISLYGEVTPITCQNFKDLCSNKNELGYRDSDIFRIISSFSIQGGNVMTAEEKTKSKPKSTIGKFGHAADNLPFPPENYRILHSYKEAGVISMMKDILNKNMQDSRFFITTEPYADWADEKYVAFGRVSKGMDLVRGLTIVEVQPPSNYPTTPIKIVDSGVY